MQPGILPSRIVHRRMGMQALDEIRVRQHHLSVGFHILQQRLIALNHDMQVRQSQLVELSDQIAIPVGLTLWRSLLTSPFVSESKRIRT